MIAIIDYGMGNLRSVQKGFERVGHHASITSDPADLERADRVVLPGVGAFRDAIAELHRQGFGQPIKDWIDQGKPFLGICLGLQLLFETSYEEGVYEGLGVIPGEVVKFDVLAGVKVPHMGWNQVRSIQRAPIFDGLPEQPHFYFVHSYYVVPNDRSWVALEADYPAPFCAAVWRDNLFATQFHPEKSQADGLHVLKNFAELPLVCGATHST